MRRLAKVVHSACPLNCWDSCGFKVTIEDGRVIKVEGDDEHPITKGKICGRGRMLEKRINSGERILHPLKKINGEFQQISWEQALDEIAIKLTEYREQYGTTSVLHSHDYANGGLLINLDQRFFNCYGGVTEVTGSICWGSGIEAQGWDFGDAYSHAPGDLMNSKSIVVWGRNVARTNMHLYEELKKAQKSGAKLYVIDPIYNATAKIADQYISIKPGFDGFLAAGIIKEIVRLKLEDREFIHNYSLGFEDLLSTLEKVSLTEISQFTEIPEETITQLARIYAERPVATMFGLGMQRYANGGNTIRLIDALVAVSGNVGIPGGGANFANRQVGQSFQIDTLTLSERKTASRSFTMMKQAEGILTAKDPEIKMAFVTCGNPLTQLPDTNKARTAFSSLETLVVMDQFMTDTAELADYILPVTSAFETEDVYYASMYHHFVNHGPKLVEPRGEAKTDEEIWRELANRLGFGEDFAYTREEWLNLGLSSLKDYGITIEHLRENKFAELPVDKIPWQDRKFKTPSKKYEFTSGLGKEAGFTGEITLKMPAESTWSNQSLAEKYPYSLLSIHPLRSNHSQHFHVLGTVPEVKVEVSEDIANEKGLENGDIVKVWNDRGNIRGKISVLKKAHPKTINIDEGMWRRFGGSVNQLTSDRESDNKLGSTVFDCLVNIEKV